MDTNDSMLGTTTPGLQDNSAGSNSGTSARGIADMARGFANQAQQKAGEQVRSSIDKGRTRAADTLHDVARTLMQSNENGSESENPAGEYLTRAGEQVQRAADYLQNADMRRLLSETESFARRQPAVFLGGAFALGVLAARFLKSTRPDDSMNDPGAGDQWADRELSLSSFREPDGYSADSGRDSSMRNSGVGNSGLGTSSLGVSSADDLDWPGGMGESDMPADLGPSGRR